jgi:predicted DNA-binding protein with PD1-like motif
MERSEGTTGRVFVLRLRNGEILHESVERSAKANGIAAATVIAVGGADAGSVLTVGPAVPLSQPVEPLRHVLDAPHEFTGNGTIFPDASGEPVLHMHCSCGREGRSVTGCVRSGVRVWLVMEVVITEIVGTNAKRLMDPGSGFELLVTGTD